LQLGSRDQTFPRKLFYYGLYLKECQKSKERIENTKMAKFEAPGISYSFKISDRHKISFFNDGGLKPSYFDIFDVLFPFLAFVKL